MCLLPCGRRTALDYSTGKSGGGYRRKVGLPDGCGFVLQLFGLIMSDQGINDGLKPAIHDFSKLVDGESNAVVGHAVLGEIVSTNLFTAIAASHHGPSLLGQRFLLLLEFHLV